MKSIDKRRSGYEVGDKIIGVKFIEHALNSSPEKVFGYNQIV
jgi:hypothetical protein